MGTLAEEKVVGTPSDAASRLTPEQNEAINRKSLDRMDAITEVTWKRRSAGLWGGGVVGGLWGLAFSGGVLATLAVVGPLGVAWSAPFFIGKIIATYVMAGIASGSVIGATVGASAGAVAGGMREKDRNAVKHGRSIDPVPDRDPTFAERLNLLRGTKQFFDWKNVLLFGAIGLGLGALMVATGGAASLAIVGIPNTLLAGYAAETTVLTTMTMFGSVFGVGAFPTMIRNATDLAGFVLSGKVWEKKKDVDVNTAFTKNDGKCLQSIGSGLGRSSQVQLPTVFKNTHQIEGTYLKPGANMQRVIQQDIASPQTPTIH